MHEVLIIRFVKIVENKSVVVSHKQEFVHKLLINSLVKLAKKKRVVRYTDRQDMTIAVD